MISPIVIPDSIYFTLATQFSIHMDGVDLDYLECTLALACQFYGKKVTVITFAEACLP